MSSDEAEEGLVYTPQKLKNLSFPPVLSLVYGMPPLPIAADQQAVLVGLLLDQSPLALVEVNGEGRVVAQGDLIGNYRVAKITKSEVVLEHKERK